MCSRRWSCCLRCASRLPLAVAEAYSVLFWRRAVGWWYHRQERREGASGVRVAAGSTSCIWLTGLLRRSEAALKTLRKKQRDELERLKKKTKFDETRSLLERYDEKARVRVRQLKATPSDLGQSDGRMPGAFGSPSPSVSGSPNTTSNRARNVPQLAGTPGTPSKAGGNADASSSSAIRPESAHRPQ